MEKSKNIVKAINRNVRSSPRKVNLLLKNIRGLKADIAIRAQPPGKRNQNLRMLSAGEKSLTADKIERVPLMFVFNVEN